MLTDDIEPTKAFYCDLLGLEVGERPPLPFPGHWLYSTAWRACISPSARRTRRTREARPLAEALPVDHLAFEPDGTSSFAGDSRRRASRSAANAVAAAGIRQLFFDDPNGARIELVVSE